MHISYFHHNLHIHNHINAHPPTHPPTHSLTPQPPQKKNHTIPPNTSPGDILPPLSASSSSLPPLPFHTYLFPHPPVTPASLIPSLSIRILVVVVVFCGAVCVPFPFLQSTPYVCLSFFVLLPKKKAQMCVFFFFLFLFLDKGFGCVFFVALRKLVGM